jgi:ketosteroid isomerase-like protein
MSDHTATVASIYQAFGHGDVATILAALSDNVQWEAWNDNHAQRANVPWLRRREGKAGAGEFFQIAAGFTIHDFQVISLMGGGNQVAAEILIDATPQGGVRYRDEEIHLWTFDDSGKVIRLRHYVDTAKHIAAAHAQM